MRSIAWAIICAFALAPASKATIIAYEDDGVRVVKKMDGHFIGLTTVDKSSGEERCRVQYLKDVGATPKGLDTIPLKTALLCHEYLPVIRKKLLKSRYDVLLGGAESPKPLEMPTFHFVSREDVSRVFRERGLGDTDTSGLVCWSWTHRKDNSVYCADATWAAGGKKWKGYVEFAVVHELAHLAFHGAGSKPFPGWLSESLANYVAHEIFSRNKNILLCGHHLDNGYPQVNHYSEGYSCGAALLDFAVHYYQFDLAGFATDLRQSGASDRWDDNNGVPDLDLLLRRHLFKNGRDMTVDDLWHRCVQYPVEKHGCEGGIP